MSCYELTLLDDLSEAIRQAQTRYCVLTSEADRVYEDIIRMREQRRMAAMSPEDRRREMRVVGGARV